MILQTEKLIQFAVKSKLRNLYRTRSQTELIKDDSGVLLGEDFPPVEKQGISFLFICSLIKNFVYFEELEHPNKI